MKKFVFVPLMALCIEAFPNNLPTVNVSAELDICNYDHDCKVGYFCDRQNDSITRNCQKCLQCQSLYNRDRGHATCHKDPYHCGECLEGFVQGEIDHLCVKGILTTESKRENNSFKINWWLIVGIAIGMVAIGELTYCYCKRRKRYKEQNDSQKMIQELLPEK